MSFDQAGSVGISQSGKSGGDTFGGAGAGAGGGYGGGTGVAWVQNTDPIGIGVGAGGDAGAGAANLQGGGDVSDNTSIGTISISS
ncbi:MAG: hypothetical protein HQL51_11110 [Magnetococcales bacterium]|nr:hypothetical protein [Magnetococcales bacterium]